MARIRRHDLLAGLHRLLRPRSYLEIGVNDGSSLTLARCPSIAVDPFYSLTMEQHCDLHLVRATSDEFFARPHPLAHFAQPTVDLAFIDGMHLAEYALRDLVNVERFSNPTTVAVIDDMLPRAAVEAIRDRSAGREGKAWTGDVYKILPDLLRLRPDLVCLEVDTAPTGTVVVLGLDAASRVLLDAVDDLVESYVTPDPQDVPPEVLDRSRACDPEWLLGLPLWERLADLRDAGPVTAADVRTAVDDAGVTGLVAS